MATTTTTKQTLPKEVFAVEITNHELLKLAYNAYLANGRENHAKTLRRGEVSGGGRKPHKQKGTGRARVGSSRTPIWRKGGVVFGPLGIENYRKDMPKQAKRIAIRQALTLAAEAGEIVVVTSVPTTGKTKELAAFLSDQKIAEAKRIVIAVANKTPELIRATNNLPGVELVQATYLNVFTILNADKLVMTEDAVKAIQEWLGGTK